MPFTRRPHAVPFGTPAPSLMVRMLAAVAVLALSGCSALDDNGFEVSARPSTLTLDNGTGRLVYYVALESISATTVDLFPDVTRWNRLAAGRTLAIPYAELDGYDAGDDEAVVFWSTGGRSSVERVRL